MMEVSKFLWQSFAIALIFTNVVKDAESHRTCEYKTVSMKCSKPQVINVVSAMYGRHGHLSECWGVFFLSHDCDTGSDAKKRISKHCDGKYSCSFKADNGFFGNPCGGQNKYLDYEYKCVDCPGGKTGEHCNDCVAGRYGQDCQQECGCDVNLSVDNKCDRDGQCSCINDNITGQNCDQCKANTWDTAKNCTACIENYFNYPSCEDCKCNNVGSVTLQCDLENGECACKDGFIGEKCDACAKSTWSFERNCKGCIENHFNFNNDTECEECFCNPEGSESLQCLKDGSCVCKPNVGKGELNNDGLVEKCDYCLPNFYGFPNCKDCNCNIDGSEFSQCNDEGMCTCKQNVIGEKCDKCAEGFESSSFPDCSVVKIEFEALTISKSNQSILLDKWSPEFNVSLDLTIEKFDAIHRRNIFHFTDVEEDGIGDDHLRLPALWLNEDNNIEVCHSINGNKYFCKNYPVELKKVYHIFIQQINEILSISVNGEIIASATNKDSYLPKNIVVFTSNPWDLAFTSDYGSVDNFIISSNVNIKTNICESIAENIKVDMEQGINDRAKAIFCDLDTEKKRALLGCPSLKADMVEELLTPDTKCNKTMEWDDESQMIFTDPVVIEKAERECGENPLCMELKSKIMKSIEEQSSFMDKYFGDRSAFFDNTIPVIEEIHGVLIDYLSNGKIETKKEGDMNNLLDGVLQTYFKDWENWDKESEDYKAILEIQYQFKNATAFDPTVLASNQNIIDSTKKVVRAQYNKIYGRQQDQAKWYQNKRQKVNDYYNQCKLNFRAMSNVEKLTKGLTALNKVLGAAPKLCSHDGWQIASGVVDIADAIAQFLPPPASIVTGTVSSLLGIFTGEGAQPSTEQIIQEGFEKQKAFISEKFSEQADFIQKEIDYLKDYISMEIVEDTRRTSVALLDEITDKFTFTSVLKEESINHQEFVNLILQIIGIFEDSSSISKVRSTFTSKCDKPFKEEYNEKGLPLKRTCVLIFYSYITTEKYRDIIMGKLIDLVKKSEVKQDDIEKKSELSQLIGALTSVQGRRKSNLINWIKTVPLSDDKRYIPCQMFKIEADQLWEGQMITYRESLVDYLAQLNFDLDLNSCQDCPCKVGEAGTAGCNPQNHTCTCNEGFSGLDCKDTTRAMVFSGSNVVEVTDWAQGSKTCSKESDLVKGLEGHPRKGAVGGVFNRTYPVVCGGMWVHRHWVWDWDLRPYREDKYFYDCKNLVTGQDILKTQLIDHRIFSASVMIDDDRMMIIGGKGVKTSEIVNFKTNTTTKVTLDGMKYPIQKHCAVYHNNTVYIIGGQGDDINKDDVEANSQYKNALSYDSVFAYRKIGDEKTEKWIKISVDPLNIPRHYMACGLWKMEVNKPQIIIAGGLSYTNLYIGSSNTQYGIHPHAKEVEVLDLVTGKWSKGPDLPKEVLGGKMIWTEPKLAKMNELPDSTLMMIGNKESYIFNATLNAIPRKQKFKDYEEDGMILIQVPYDQNDSSFIKCS